MRLGVFERAVKEVEREGDRWKTRSRVGRLKSNSFGVGLMGFGRMALGRRGKESVA